MNSRPLAVVLGTLAHDRLHAALSLAAASAALRRTVSIYLHAEGVRLLDPAQSWPEDARFTAAGAPAIRELFVTLTELGATVTVCQTGLALTGISAAMLPGTAQPGGLIDFLSRTGDAEVVLG